MDFSNIKKIVLEEGKVVVVDGDNALVVMGFDDYVKMKQQKQQGFLLNNEVKPVNSLPEKPVESEILPVSEKPSEKPSEELTLDDLPF